MKLQRVLFVIMVFLLSGCQSMMPTSTPMLQITPTNTDLPRWMAYEKALSQAILHSDNGYCEWEIWGRNSNDVYVWALCKARDPIGTAGSVPAVIKLSEGGIIGKIIIPRDGNDYPTDIKDLFPLNVQKMIDSLAFNAPEAEKHIQERMISKGPPLIAVSGTPLP